MRKLSGDMFGHRRSRPCVRRSVPLNLEDLDIPDIDGDLKSYQTEAGATFSVRTVQQMQTFLELSCLQDLSHISEHP